MAEENGRHRYEAKLRHCHASRQLNCRVRSAPFEKQRCYSQATTTLTAAYVCWDSTVHGMGGYPGNTVHWRSLHNNSDVEIRGEDLSTKSVNWFAWVQRSNCTSCRTPPSSELHANPIPWIWPGLSSQILLPLAVSFRDRKTNFRSFI